MMAKAYHALDPADRTGCAILCGTMVRPAAVNFFGPRFGLPRAISGHNNYFLWGTGEGTGEVMMSTQPAGPTTT